MPIMTDRPIAPDNLLNMISCGCKADGCGALCGCRKVGLNCSSMCAKCNGETCTNVADIITSLDEDEEMENSTPVSRETTDDEEFA